MVTKQGSKPLPVKVDPSADVNTIPLTKYRKLFQHTLQRQVTVTVLTQLATHSFGTLQRQPKHGSLSNPLENQLALG